ncbi:insulin receptor substrate 1-B [Chanos chanos]|uniref:Insulin receptor substrate 1-B n=1 Tax=Chanos chanos TaxID=29144 RepID=A0A6J2W462_CHACN|nr:insulin receptor substrate 1-B-like [Chanos chanos]
MESQAGVEQQSYDDVRKSGYLRKQKSTHRRFFVLRAASERGPARLEYYENEKKFRSKSPVPKKAVNLESCFNINKRADSKNKYMVVLYTRGESFAIAADTEEIQNEWYQAMMDLQSRSRTPDDCSSGGEGGLPSPGPAFKEVWQVKVWPKGLGQARNLVGIYRLCLTDKTVNFVKLNSDVAAVVLQLMNVRRCGHSENFFFIEVGRSAMTGPGEFWMQVEDSVVAQNMHETLLEAMKALSEEFRQRTKSQSVGASGSGGTTSNPISVPSRRHHPNLPPSQVGFSRRARTETPGAGGFNSTNTSPTTRQGFSRSRTASIGARTEDGGSGALRGTALSTSPSFNGSSCSNTPTLRPKPTRAPTPAKITLSLARYTPNPTPSPAPSLSSSSGHGSECGLGGAVVGAMPICTYTRVPQRVSVSGSPSDYGSSDECGSSPGEHSFLTAGLTAAVGESTPRYALMGQRDGSHHHKYGRRVLRRSSSRESEVERRLLSKRASLPPSSAQERTPLHRRDGEEEDKEYAVMSRNACKDSLTSGGSAVTSVGQVGVTVERNDSIRGDAARDSGYMSMLPGVTVPPTSLALPVAVSNAVSTGGDEYMAMTPNNSVSPPQHIRLPAIDGYMMMSPNSSCSPDLHAMGGCMWGSRGSMESRTSSDYMNMSPVSARSACSTPPSHPEQHPLQPKMMYSYFSLPRSYKHTALATRFEDDLGQGKRTEGGCVEGNEGGDGSRTGHEGYPSMGEGESCQLSLSSSSFSSSSTSSESLEDRPLSLPAGGGSRTARLSKGHRAGSMHPKDLGHALHQQRCSPVAQTQGQVQQRKGRPSSLYVDMSKANTLPRVRETLMASASQSPGEYVSIVYHGSCSGQIGEGKEIERGHSVVHGHPRPLHRPPPCLSGTANLPRSFSTPLSTSISTSSEYVNMDLGNSPSPLSLTPPTSSPSTLTPTPAIASKTREELTQAPQLAQDADIGHRKSGTTTLSSGEMPVGTFTEYTEMVFGLGANAPSLCPDPSQTPEYSAQSCPIDQEKVLDLSSSSAFPDLDQGIRLVRAELLGRRRHRSDTFMTPPSRAPSSSSSLFPENTQGALSRLHAQEGPLWGNGQALDSQCVNPGMSPMPSNQASSSSLEQGLNYIDLDLASKESPQSGLDGPTASHPLFSSVLGGALVGGLGGAGLGNPSSYASIDFFKSEELRVHQSSRKDVKGRTFLRLHCNISRTCTPAL